MNFGLFNSRSICNKTISVLQLLSDFDLDICCVTETWLRKADTAKFAEMKDLGYAIHNQPRAGRGGGVAILFKNCLKLTPQNSKRYKTFESIESTYKSSTGDIVRIATIYRSGTSTSLSANIPLFLDEFECFLTSLLDKPGKPLIMGDFNVHVEDLSDSTARRFIHVLKSNGWQQHVASATHRDGGTLDLVITRDNTFLHDSLEVSDMVITDSGTSSDHLFIAFNCNISPEIAVPPQPILYRKIRAIDMDSFTEDILKSPLCDVDSFVNLNNAVNLYDTHLLAILDKHAPQKMFIPKPNSAEWWTNHCQEAKTMRRRIERIYRSNMDNPDAKKLFKKAVTNAASVIDLTRDNFYREKLKSCEGDPKKTYSAVNKILNKEKINTATPSASSDAEIAENFKNFFREKVDKIYKGIEADQTKCHHHSAPLPTAHVQTVIHSFDPVSDGELVSIIKEMSQKYCDLDPIPTKIMLKCLPELLPVLSYIVNGSLKSGSFPKKLKEALVRPSLKKTNLDSECLSNYRPISNLPFLSKIIEKCVAIQLTKYLEENHLFSKYQSGYRKYHSCETATTKIHNDILLMIDNRSKIVLLLLDLSAAFDTVNHNRLLKKLHLMYGISGIPLLWIESYLKDRSFCVKVKDSCSVHTELSIGVPQGSILGPLLFILYTKDLEDIAEKHGCYIHLYADDTQLYFTFDVINSSNLELKIKACLDDIKSWMVDNFLQLNASKTEVMILSSKHDHSMSLPAELQLTVNGSPTEVNSSVKSLGVFLDNKLSMSDHITSIIQACNLQIRNLWFIASKLSMKLKIQLVHALVLSKLDYCNSVFYGISTKDLQRLQLIQNSAVRFIFGKGKRAHVTDLLRKVHFLPVKYRIMYKIALLTFKCVNNLAPSYLKELIILRKPTVKNVRLDSDYFLLETPHYSLVSTEKAFSVCCPKIWNSLPFETRSACTLTQFKSSLKSHYFELAFS